jgi:hypothetical protein
MSAVRGWVQESRALVSELHYLDCQSKRVSKCQSINHQRCTIIDRMLAILTYTAAWSVQYTHTATLEYLKMIIYHYAELSECLRSVEVEECLFTTAKFQTARSDWLMFANPCSIYASHISTVRLNRLPVRRVRPVSNKVHRTAIKLSPRTAIALFPPCFHIAFCFLMLQVDWLIDWLMGEPQRA